MSAQKSVPHQAQNNPDDAQLTFGIDAQTSEKDFSSLARVQPMQNVFNGAAQHLCGNTPQKGASQFESKVLGLYQQGQTQNVSQPTQSKPNYAFEKKMLQQGKATLNRLKQMMGGAVNKVTTKKVDLSFLLRRLQWLSFYYESVRRQRILDVIKRQDDARKSLHRGQQALHQALLDEAILLSNEQMADLQTQSLFQDNHTYSAYQISSMVTGVYVASIVANLADRGHQISDAQRMRLQQFFHRIHHNQFEPANQIETMVMVPPVELEQAHMHGMLQIIEQPLQAQQQFQSEWHQASEQDAIMQQLIAAHTPAMNNSGLYDRLLQTPSAPLEDALNVGRDLMAMTAQQQHAAVQMTDLSSVLSEDARNSMSASV